MLCPILSSKRSPTCKILSNESEKVDIMVLVWTLNLGFPAGAKRTLTSLQGRFEQVAKIETSRYAFYDHLTPALALVLRKLVDRMLDVRIEQTTRKIDDQSEGFKELLAVDPTVPESGDLPRRPPTRDSQPTKCM